MEKYIAPDRKRIPYGMMNFAVIRRDDCYYVDKTRFIPMIEEADKFFFFIRPRRFGKSLTVNMLQHYYDILAKDKFEALFSDLYIGKHPTRDRNSYLVLYLNFSGIVGELHNYRKGLDAHCQTMFDYFCDIYADYLPKGIKEERIPEIHGIRRPLEFITAVHCAGEDGKTCKQIRLAQSQLRSAVAAHGSARDKVILPFL